MKTRINVHLPDDLHTALRVYCIQQRRTMADVIIEALTRTLTPAEPTPTSEAKPPT